MQPLSASAQRGDGIKRQVNTESGKVSFIGPESGSSVPAAKALGLSTFARPADPAMALAKRFAPEFGLRNPERDLAVKKTKNTGDGRLTVRYQQNYEGIPVMGGELVVNTNANGDLYSMNGEVSPELSLSTEPAIDSEQAKQTALQAMAKWYQTTEESFVTTEPELWIYDESLLHSSTRSAELVWRMEVTSVDNGLPVRELILVNAVRGNISLHFNQIDMAWHSAGNVNTIRTSEAPAISSASSNTEMSNDTKANQNTTNVPTYYTLVGTTWYVATTGNDSNSCAAAGSPCLTINGAIGKAADGDTIRVATGTYTGTGMEVVVINKSVTLLGGWNAAFTTQSGATTIDAQTLRRGVLIHNVSATLDRFVIKNALIADYGAGILSSGNLTLSRSLIQNNSTGNTCNGGGIYFGGNVLLIENSTISGNSAGCDGGGIYVQSGAVTINNSTITKNSAYSFSADIYSTGGGIYIYSGVNIYLRNTIIANNIGGDCNNYAYSPYTSQGYNLISVTCTTFNATTGDLVGTSDAPINPRLTPLQDNGGPTFTHSLMEGSIAIDAGNPATPGSGGNTCLGTDQRNVARPIGLSCDIGAYEGSVSWVPSPIVNTYTSQNTTFLFGDYLCDEMDPTCATGDAHAKAAHQYAIGAYNLYYNKHSRDSINNAGMPIISSVHYRSGYSNSFWDGRQMVYGDAGGWPLADDVVAHEFTHGVTQYESNLFYYYQSGAINESFSDLWGEYYDQTNGQGNDVAGVKWQIGEDISGLGAIRSMSNPPAFGDPDRISNSNYDEGQDDSGGVHTNSGVNNKAVFLMVDGGTFNGKTVSALGWDKTLAIYYEANTNLLISGSDYSDLYYTLQQACSNLIGQNGIVAGDCTEVKDAIDAVEMNSQPAPNFNTDAPFCAAGITPVVTFADNLESGTGKWTFNNGPYARWQYDTPEPFGPYAHSGQHSLYADDYPDVVTDATARLTAFTVPTGAYLHFYHAYDFEAHLPSPGPYYFDGGVLEYSINGGSTWTDAGSLINFNGYDAVIYTGAGNPLSGRSAFAGSSHGYISTRLNLATLAGKNVMFRWRMGLDESVPALGWWVDDIKLYTCPSPANVSVLIGGTNMGNYLVQGSTSLKKSYPGIDNGPVRVQSTNGVPIVASERVAYSPDGGTTWTSHSELMGLPANLVHTSYTFPWYNNLTLDSQLRFGNVGNAPTDVTVTIAGATYGPYHLNLNQSRRVSYPGLDQGPVVIQSTGGVPIIASLRVAYTPDAGTTWTSFSEMMGLPSNMLTNSYTFPWYNNLTLNSQLRFGNVGMTGTNVTVTIGGVAHGPYHLAPNASFRVSYPGLDQGPVKITSSGNVPIIASMRVAYSPDSGLTWTDFSEMMGLPTTSLSTRYSFPAYNNVNLNSQLRFGNVGTTSTNVTVTINGVPYGPYSVAPNASRRISYPLNSGPVVIQSSGGVPIIASLRVAYTPDGGTTWMSFSEMMGLPQSQLTTSYLFPWYNNVGLDTQLRFGVP